MEFPDGGDCVNWAKTALLNCLVWIMLIILSIIPIAIWLGVAAFVGRMGWVHIPVFGALSVLYAAVVVIFGFVLHPHLHAILHRLVQRL